MTATLPPFRHEALFYDGDAAFHAHARAFVQDGLDRDEPVLVAVPTARLDPLRQHFRGVDPRNVSFAPMEVMGRNPARIIQAWSDFVADNVPPGRAGRGIGEPIWATRTPAELVECERHESLLNVAFAHADGFTLLCPYDLTTLPAEVIATAGTTHPHLWTGGVHSDSATFAEVISPLLDVPLSAVPPDAHRRCFSADSAISDRQWAVRTMTELGLDPALRHDASVAISEALTNSVMHGGGTGTVATWATDDHVVCEIRNLGTLSDPLAGRRRPPLSAIGGRGLWLMNQLCDLVQLRRVDDELVVRLNFTLIS